MEQVEGDSRSGRLRQRRGNGRIDGEGEAGEVDDRGDHAGDEGGVAGVLFGVLDQAAEAVVGAADFLLEAFAEEFPEGGFGGGWVAAETLGVGVVVGDDCVEGGFEVGGLGEEGDRVWVGGGGLGEVVEGGGGEGGHGGLGGGYEASINFCQSFGVVAGLDRTGLGKRCKNRDRFGFSRGNSDANGHDRSENYAG